jgi:tetratricopeptide (TPR) repeat protein
VGLQLDGTPTENSEELQKERTPEEEARIDLLFKRILQLGDDNQEARYFVAVHNLRQGKVAVARSIMESLAPSDAAGLDLAHAWLAEDMYRRSVQGEAINPVAIKHHLKHSLENPRIKYDPLLFVLYAKLLEQDNDIDGAARILTRASEQEPKLQLEPILLYARRGLGNQALVAADALIARLTTKTTDPRISEEDRIAAYLNIARAYQITNRIDETIPVLQKGLSIAPNHPDLRRTLSDTYRIKFRMSMSSAQGRGQASMDTLNAAIAADPTNIAIQSELSLLSQLGIASTEANREELIKLIARQGASTTVRMLLAESAFGRSDYKAAINDYELVLADLPNMTIALNNLAMLYTKTEPPSLDKAKETIDRAISLSPDVAEFLDTKGDVEAAAGNANTAIEAYSKALERSPERLQTRDKLIAIYEKENRTEDAQKQKELRIQVENRIKAIQEQMAKAQAASAEAAKQNAAPNPPGDTSPPANGASEPAAIPPAVQPTGEANSEGKPSPEPKKQ